MPRFGALLSIALLGCHGSPTEPTQLMLRVGKWTGTQIEIMVSDSQIIFTSTTCVRGYFARPTIGQDGTFVSDGSLEPMAGPPPPPPFPHGRITGVVRGDSLVISATYDNGFTIGPFTATYLTRSPIFYPCPV
jgi:hypothetical protein